MAHSKLRRMNLDARLSLYQVRAALFSGDDLAQRRKEFASAYGMNRLEGAGDLGARDEVIAELWVTGRISDREFLELCTTLAIQSPGEPQPAG